MKRKAEARARLKAMAHANTTTGLSGWPVNSPQGIPHPPSTVLEDNDLFAIRVLFDLLNEWEFKEAMNANLNQS